MTLDRQPGEEGLHLAGAHLPGVTQPMKAHERPHPMDVGFLGAYAVVKVAQPLAQLIQQALRRWACRAGEGNASARTRCRRGGKRSHGEYCVFRQLSRPARRRQAPSWRPAAPLSGSHIKNGPEHPARPLLRCVHRTSCNAAPENKLGTTECPHTRHSCAVTLVTCRSAFAGRSPSFCQSVLWANLASAALVTLRTTVSSPARVAARRHAALHRRPHRHRARERPRRTWSSMRPGSLTADLWLSPHESEVVAARSELRMSGRRRQLSEAKSKIAFSIAAMNASTCIAGAAGTHEAIEPHDTQVLWNRDSRPRCTPSSAKRLRATRRSKRPATAWPLQGRCLSACRGPCRCGASPPTFEAMTRTGSRLRQRGARSGLRCGGSS